MLQCGVVWCGALQRVAACCSVLQYVAVCCSVLQCVAVRCSALWYVAVQYLGGGGASDGVDVCESVFEQCDNETKRYEM